MSQKNLELCNCRINDIDAETIKQLLIDAGFTYPTEEAKQIGKAIINLATAAVNTDPGINQGELQFSLLMLERVFDFFTDLMDLQHNYSN